MSVTLKALVDSGANGSIFINTPVAIDVAKLFQTTVVPLNSDCRIRGYDGKTEERVTHAIILHLAVDGRRQANVPMLIANLGQHDMILGRKWCEQHDIWLDVRNRRLVWPREYNKMGSIVSLASSVWQSLTFWKALAIAFALLNLKTLPLVWHVRHFTIPRVFGIY